MNIMIELLSSSISSNQETVKIFDQRSSERLVRDEVVLRAPKDPYSSFLEAVMELQSNTKNHDNEEKQVA